MIRELTRKVGVSGRKKQSLLASGGVVLLLSLKKKIPGYTYSLDALTVSF